MGWHGNIVLRFPGALALACYWAAEEVLSGPHCHALADDLVYPTALINLYITLSWETQVHLANMATSFTSYLWSYLYVAAEYDPSLYTPLSNWPRPGSFEATLPASPCVGLAHASCVGQGMGGTTDPGANNYLRYDDAGRTVVVHACERELCHCAWLIDQSDFDTYCQSVKFTKLQSQCISQHISFYVAYCQSVEFTKLKP